MIEVHLCARVRLIDFLMLFERRCDWSRPEHLDAGRHTLRTGYEEIYPHRYSGIHGSNQPPAFEVHVDDRGGPSSALD